MSNPNIFKLPIYDTDAQKAERTKLEEINPPARKREGVPEPKNYKKPDSSGGSKFSSNIDSLKYNFDTGARSNRFHVNLHCPKLNLSLDGLRCETASLPGRSLGTTEFSPYGAEESFLMELLITVEQ